MKSLLEIKAFQRALVMTQFLNNLLLKHRKKTQLNYHKKDQDKNKNLVSHPSRLNPKRKAKKERKVRKALRLKKVLIL